jgi:hypothetical protein
MKKNRKSPQILAGSLLMSLIFFVNIFAQENYPANWPKTQKIIINTSAADGAGTAQDVANFPLLVRLTKSNFPGFTSVLAGGADIRFANATGAHLPYEIERWDATGGVAEIWVKVDNVKAANATQYITMYYGNINAKDSSKSTAVFETSNNFQGVWHLGEEKGSVGDTIYKDATANRNTGTDSIVTTTQDVCVAKDHVFAPANVDYVMIPAKPSLNVMQTSYTISAWYNPNSLPKDPAVSGTTDFQHQSIAVKTGYAEGLAYSFDDATKTNVFTMQHWGLNPANNGLQNFIPKSAVHPIGSYYHLTGIVDYTGLTVKLFVNGVLEGTTPIAAPFTGPRKTDTIPLRIGVHIPHPTATWDHYQWPADGKIDEVRLENAIRSADWIKLSYSTQKPGATCVYPDSANQPPTITKQSGDTTVIFNAAISLSVSALGTGTLTYAWYKGTPSTGVLLTGKNQPTLSIPVAAYSDSGQYYCVVTGTVNPPATSKAIHVAVNNPAVKPTLTNPRPRDTSVDQGGTAKFTVTAVGSGTLTYTWYHGAIGAGTATGTNSPILTISNAKMTDSGRYYCSVANSVGTVTNDTAAHLTVISGAPKITGQPSDSIQHETYSVSFTVGASGALPLTYTWYKEGKTTALATGSNVYQISSVVLSDSGNYYCVVKNQFDSVTSRKARLTVLANPIVANPIAVTGTYVDASHVRLSITRYIDLATGASYPNADMVMIWYNTNNTWPAQASKLVTPHIDIPLSQLKTKPTQYDTTVTVTTARTTYPFDTYKFRGSVNWHVSSTKDSLPAFTDVANGASILMGKIDSIPNPVQINPVYTLGSSTVNLTLTNFSSLTAANWAGIASLSVKHTFASGASSPEDTVSKDDLQKALAASGGSYIIPYTDPRFATNDTVKWEVKFKGVAGNESPIQKATLVVVSTQIPNTSKLSIDGATPTQIQLSWTANSVAVDSVRLIYGNLGPVPIGPNQTIDPRGYTSVVISGTLTKYVVSGLSENTTYFFGLQFKKGSSYSDVTEASRISGKTSASVIDTTFHNTFKILTVNLDTASNNLVFTGRIDTTGMKLGASTLDAGIVWANDTLSAPGAVAIQGQYDIKSQLPNPLNVRCSVNVVQHNLTFGNLYSFRVWLQKTTTGGWVKPTDSSTVSYKIPLPTWQRAEFFPRGVTTVEAFGRDIIFNQTDSTTYQGISVLRRLTLPIDGSGLVRVSQAYGFDAALQKWPFTMVMHYDPSLLTGSANNIRLYHYDPVRGVWTVDYSNYALDPDLHTLTFTGISGLVSQYPFVLAVNTTPPQLTVESDMVTPVIQNSGIPIRWHVTSNIANIKSTRLYGRYGKDDGTYEVSNTQTYISDTINQPMSGDITDGTVANGQAGVKILLTVTDGLTVIVQDLSLDVRRTASDPMSPGYELWKPIKTTSVLDDSSVETSLRSFSGGSTLVYDNTKLLIYRWSPVSPTDWVPYTKEKSADFSLTPGKVLWIKTRKTGTFDLGAGKTVSLKQPVDIKLPPKSWTDVGIPYRFNVKINDIFAASKLSAEDESNLAFDEWQPVTDPKQTYVATLIYQANGSGDLSNKQKALSSLDGSYEPIVYTVYNGTDHEITLRIPPIPPAYSQQSKRAVASAAQGWSVSIKPKTANGALSSVICGYNAALNGKVAAFPPAPSFASVNVGILDEEKGTTSGIYINGERKDGYAYKVIFENKQEENTTVDFTLERSGGLAKGAVISLIDPSAPDKATNAEAGALSVSVPAQGRAYRWLVVGSAEFAKNFGTNIDRSVFALMNPSPNPFHGTLRIRYSLPQSGIEAIKCEIVDQLGRTVLTTRANKSIHPGMNELSWAPHAIAAGTYIVRLSGYDGKGKIVGRKLTRVMYLP